MIKQKLYLVIKDGKTGFINENGNIVIDCEFEGASSFSEGLARVYHNEKVGFIDLDGNMVIQPSFETATGFSNGLSAVTIDEKFGFINTKGDFIIQPSFYQAENFENGIALVMPDILSSGCFVNKKGEIILDNKEFLNSKYREGLINCCEDKKWGYIDIHGEFIIPPKFRFAREFSEGKAAVVPFNDSKGKQNKKEMFGFISKSNEEIISPIYQGSDIKFSEGLCAVWNDGYGYINESGELIIPYDFELGEHFNGGFAVFKPKGKNKKHGYLDRKGNIAIKPKFTYADGFQDDIASIGIGESFDEIKHGYINKNGDYIWEPSK